MSQEVSPRLSEKTRALWLECVLLCIQLQGAICCFSGATAYGFVPSRVPLCQAFKETTAKPLGEVSKFCETLMTSGEMGHAVALRTCNRIWKLLFDQQTAGRFRWNQGL